MSQCGVKGLDIIKEMINHMNKKSKEFFYPANYILLII